MAAMAQLIKEMCLVSRVCPAIDFHVAGFLAKKHCEKLREVDIVVATFPAEADQGRSFAWQSSHLFCPSYLVT